MLFIQIFEQINKSLLDSRNSLMEYNECVFKYPFKCYFIFPFLFDKTFGTSCSLLATTSVI
jgi:hypothetical protein